MKNNIIYSDKVSERYRKYIIKILFNSKHYYLLWGTDLGTDIDYLLLDSYNKMLGFVKLKELLTYVRSNKIEIDNNNIKKWAKEYKNNKPYITYDLDSINKILNKKEIQFPALNREDAFKLLNFYNLFSDFAYQTNSKNLATIMNKKELKVFFNFVNDVFFWETNERIKEKYYNKKFDQKKFVSTYHSMIEVFMRNIIVIKDGNVSDVLVIQ